MIYSEVHCLWIASIILCNIAWCMTRRCKMKHDTLWQTGKEIKIIEKQMDIIFFYFIVSLYAVVVTIDHTIHFDASWGSIYHEGPFVTYDKSELNSLNQRFLQWGNLLRQEVIANEYDYVPLNNEFWILYLNFSVIFFWYYTSKFS